MYHDELPTQPIKSLHPTPEPFVINKRKLIAAITGAFALLSISIAAASPSLLTVSIAVVMTLIGIECTLRLFRGTLDEAREKVVDEIYSEARKPTEPSKRLRLGMFYNKYSKEKLLIETRLHPMCIIKWWIALLLLQVIVGLGIWFTPEYSQFIANMGLRSTSIYWLVYSIVWSFCMLIIGVKILMWWHDSFGITTFRIVAAHGLFDVSYPTMPLTKLTDENFIVPLLSRILAWLRIIDVPYGHIIVESAGQDQALSKIRFMRQVEALNGLIIQYSLQQ